MEFPVITDKGTPKAVVANAVHVFNEHPEWKDVLAFDTFSMRTAALRAPPWASKGNAPFESHAWSDVDDIRASAWLQLNTLLVSPDVVRQAVEVAARRQEFHPVADYLDSLKWDGRARVARLATDHFGAERSP